MAPFIIIFLILLLPSIGCRSKNIEATFIYNVRNVFLFSRDISSGEKIEFSFCKWKKNPIFSLVKRIVLFFFQLPIKKNNNNNNFTFDICRNCLFVCVCVYEHGKNLRKQQRFSVYLSFFLLSWMSACKQRTTYTVIYFFFFWFGCRLYCWWLGAANIIQCVIHYISNTYTHSYIPKYCERIKIEIIKIIIF